MQKKTTDTLTMTSNDKNTLTQTDFHVGLIRLDRQYNETKTTNTEKERKSPRLAFLKISATAHLAHLQSSTSQPTTQALQKSQIFQPNE